MKFETFKEFPADEVIVSLVNFNGRILLATSYRIYELKDDKIVQLEIQKMVDIELVTLVPYVTPQLP